MKDRFKVIGYYICEIIDTPKWLPGFGRRILSVSGCIGAQHPRWECFMGGWIKGEVQEYQERLRLDKERYREFLETAGSLFDAERLDELKGSNSHALMNGENDDSPCLGNDILGWDIGGFESMP